MYEANSIEKTLFRENVSVLVKGGICNRKVYYTDFLLLLVHKYFIYTCLHNMKFNLYKWFRELFSRNCIMTCSIYTLYE